MKIKMNYSDFYDEIKRKDNNQKKVNESLFDVKPGLEYTCKKSYKNRFKEGKKYTLLDINKDERPLVRDENQKRFRMRPETFEKLFDIESAEEEIDDEIQPVPAKPAKKINYYWCYIYESPDGEKVHGEWKRSLNELEEEKKEYEEKGYKVDEHISIERKHAHLYAKKHNIDFKDVLQKLADHRVKK